MKKLSLFIIIASLMASCKICDDNHAAELNKEKALARGEGEEKTVTETVEPEPEITVEAFDINKLAVSSTTIGTGTFPFFNIPTAGYTFVKDAATGTQTGKFIAFPTQNDAIKVDGGSSFFSSFKKDAAFEGDAVDPAKSFEEDIIKAGGVKVFEGTLQGEHKKKYDDLCSYCGDEGIDTSKPLVSYAIHRPGGEGNIYYVMQKNGETGTVQILQQKVINPDDEVITVDGITHDLLDKGKSILHINFDTGNAHINPIGEEDVNKIAKVLKDNPTLNIDINGYTDSIGDPVKNKALSVDRANAVKEILVKGGIDVNRLEAHGMGADNPIGDNATAFGQATNRRVELVKK